MQVSHVFTQLFFVSYMLIVSMVLMNIVVAVLLDEFISTVAEVMQARRFGIAACLAAPKPAAVPACISVACCCSLGHAARLRWRGKRARQEKRRTADALELKRQEEDCLHSEDISGPLDPLLVNLLNFSTIEGAPANALANAASNPATVCWRLCSHAALDFMVWGGRLVFEDPGPL